MNGDLRAGLAEIEAKLDLVRRTEAEHGFGIILDAPREPEEIPELPDGVTGVFRLFHRLGGDYFCFKQPDVIQSPRTWAARTVDDCPLGNPLEIGYERYGMPAEILEDIDGGAPIRIDVTSGDVYYVDPDDYIFFYKNVEVEEIHSEDFADDIVTFFNHHVLGARYPDLVHAVLGPRAVTETDRRGRHKDSWTRVLTASGLLTDPTRR